MCLACHDGSVAPDAFTPWAQTGHAEIFSQNLDAGGHYSASCFSCHTVGFAPTADNSRLQSFQVSADPHTGLHLRMYHMNPGYCRSLKAPNSSNQNWDFQTPCIRRCN